MAGLCKRNSVLNVALALNRQFPSTALCYRPSVCRSICLSHASLVDQWGGGSRVAITTRTLTQHGSNSIQVYIFDTYGAYSYDNEMFSICLAVLAKYRQESVPDS